MYRVIIMKDGVEIVNLATPHENLQFTAQKAAELASISGKKHRGLLLEKKGKGESNGE